MTHYTEDTLNAVKNFGLLHYPVKKILLLIGDVTDQPIDEYQFITDFNDTTSSLYKSYQKGKAMAEYQLDKKLLEMSRNGDLEALEKYERRLRMRADDDD